MQSTDCARWFPPLRVYIAPPYASAVPHLVNAGAQHSLLRPLHGLHSRQSRLVSMARCQAGAFPRGRGCASEPKVVPRKCHPPATLSSGRRFGAVVALAFAASHRTHAG